MFDRRTPAVVPMDPKALAEDDGSKYSAGRGSGKELPPGQRVRLADQVPYMQMVYHPTERRLDTAVFRALFASSARQARQYVVHGHVKVNGKKVSAFAMLPIDPTSANSSSDDLPRISAQSWRPVPSRA